MEKYFKFQKGEEETDCRNYSLINLTLIPCRILMWISSEMLGRISIKSPNGFCISLLGLPGGQPRTGGLNNRNVSCHSCGDWKSKIKVSPGLAFLGVVGVRENLSWVSLLSLQMVIVSLCLFTSFSLCACVEISPFFFFFFYKDSSHIGLGPTQMLLFTRSVVSNSL